MYWHVAALSPSAQVLRDELPLDPVGFPEKSQIGSEKLSHSRRTLHVAWLALNILANEWTWLTPPTPARHHGTSLAALLSSAAHCSAAASCLAK